MHYVLSCASIGRVKISRIFAVLQERRSTAYLLQEVVVLKPGGPGSKAATGSKSKGHGRNWAVEGVVA